MFYIIFFIGFGASSFAKPAASTGGLFGASTTTSTAAGGLFGQPAGGASTGFGTGTTGGFGSTATGSVFGQQAKVS